jgi:hypothetical protein
VQCIVLCFFVVRFPLEVTVCSVFQNAQIGPAASLSRSLSSKAQRSECGADCLIRLQNILCLTQTIVLLADHCRFCTVFVVTCASICVGTLSDSAIVTCAYWDTVCCYLYLYSTFFKICIHSALLAVT